ncbi:uncharacterized protein LOC116288577 [Actinia tenebrosa]|uniref:Uncharacterized protein LOC116288577 n=1 Tax=Actinia tenebrosa TaxID=6105 RepID=A0A6P8HF91_ACTTE|nr:uncharacterized protein LOC116288577 [Actinia tenebrosa]
MSSNTGNISDQDVENCPPSQQLSCTNNTNGPSISNPPSVKRNSYMKRGGRRRRWWYFNRGLQPISELAEIKDDAVKCENHDVLPTIMDDSCVINNYSHTNTTIISSDSTQNKESYSACLKLIEKFQEVVMDSAVRVIQAAFKRFRERRRFLRIKRAVMVIQRNLRKWLETKHPCIRPTDFERQSSDGSKSDEYRETIENESEGCVTEEEDKQLNCNKSEKCQENNNTNGNESSVKNSSVYKHQENTCTSDAGNVNAGVELNKAIINVEPNCLSQREEETIESSTAQVKKLVTMSTEHEHEIVRDVKSLLEELLVKVISNIPDSDGKQNQSAKSKDSMTPVNTTDIILCSSIRLTQNDETQENLLDKANINVEQDDLNCENENQSKTTAGDDMGDCVEHMPNVTKILPDSLKEICQKFLDVSETSNPHNMEDNES